MSIGAIGNNFDIARSGLDTAAAQLDGSARRVAKTGLTGAEKDLAKAHVEEAEAMAVATTTVVSAPDDAKGKHVNTHA